jgi:integrase/recombinase XerD
MEKYGILEQQEVSEYWTAEVSSQSDASKENKELALRQFFECVGLKPIKEIDREDINEYINSSKFKNLKPKSKNQKRAQINSLLNFYERTDLTGYFPKQKTERTKVKRRDLITRKELNLLLKCAPTLQKRLLLYVMFETGARRGEIVSVRWENVEFIHNGDMIEMFLPKSKTKTRNVYLVESVPLFKQYMREVDINPNDRIFPWCNDNINRIVDRTGEIAEKRYRFDKDIYPHLFRHSRFTELVAKCNYNEAQLCQLGGWVIGSDTVRIYFHLADKDIENKTLELHGLKKQEDTEEPKFEAISCPDPECSVKNFHQNEFCYSCGQKLTSNTFNKLKKENEELEDEMVDLKSIATDQAERLKKQEELIDKLISKVQH